MDNTKGETPATPETNLEGAISIIENGIKANEAKTADMNAKITEMYNELEKIKTISFMSPESSKKALDIDKCKYWKALTENNKALMSEMRAKARQNEPSVSSGSPTAVFSDWMPTEYSSNIIDNLAKYGIARKMCDIYPMSNLTKNIKQVKGRVTAGWTEAANTIANTAPSGAGITLTAKKMAALVYFDKEEMEDLTPADIAKIEEIAAQGIAYREDYVIFAGNGAADYSNAGMTGIKSAVTTNALSQGTSGSLSNISADDLANMIGKVTVPGARNLAFFFNKALYSTIIKLKDGDGNYLYKIDGNGAVTIWGFPVIWLPNDSTNSLLPGSPTSGQVYGIFGDMKGVIFGDRRGLEVTMSTDYAFASDQVAVKFTERYDIYVQQEFFATLAV